MLPLRRLVTAAPPGLLSRSARPLPVSRARIASSIRSLAGISDEKAPHTTTTGDSKESKGPRKPWEARKPGGARKPREPPKSKGPEKPETQKPAYTNAWNFLRRELIECDGETSKLTVSGNLVSAQLGEDLKEGHVVLKFEGVEQEIIVSSLWLRDSCTCPQCVTPSSGQKTFHTHDMASAEVREVSVVPQAENASQTTLRIVWAMKQAAGEASVASEAAAAATATSAGQEHVSEYDSKDLLFMFANYKIPQYPLNLARRLWDRRMIEKELKPVSYADWMAADNGSNTEFYRGLLDLYQLGILIVDDVPDSENAVRKIANQIGNIQTTFYGELFDVVSKPNAENVAYTNVFLCLHQDLLYMNDPPYIQLLHCLRNECDGGESLFCDSLLAAVDMQINEPAHAKTLSSTPVSYHYERNGHYYFNQRPVFEAVGGSKQDRSTLKHTAWSPPFQNSFASKNNFMANPADGPPFKPEHHLRTWAAAAKSFSDRLEHPDNMLEVKLKAGQCVLFNNRRVLHGRRQFNTSDGTRWLKGTYIDEQTFHSRITDMLRRGVNGTVPVHRPFAEVMKSEHLQVSRLKAELGSSSEGGSE